MNTLEKAKDEDGMEFTEALDYSVDKRKFLIRRSAEEADLTQTDILIDCNFYCVSICAVFVHPLFTSIPPIALKQKM